MTERPVLFSGPEVRAILDGRKSVTRRVIMPSIASCVMDWFGRPPKRPPTDWQTADSIRHFYNDGGRSDAWWSAYRKEDGLQGCIGHFQRPHGKVGDRLWVKEALFRNGLGRAMYAADGVAVRNPDYDGPYHCILSTADWPKEWKPTRRRSPATSMPRRFARITLEITDVRVQRLTQISAHDVEAEGIITSAREVPQVTFSRLWNSINAKRGFSWESDPWVWVLGFRRVSS